MKKTVSIIIIIIAIGIGLVSYSQMSQDQGLDTEIIQNETEQIKDVDIVQNEPQSFTVNLQEKVGVTEVP